MLPSELTPSAGADTCSSLKQLLTHERQLLGVPFPSSFAPTEAAGEEARDRGG